LQACAICWLLVLGNAGSVSAIKPDSFITYYPSYLAGVMLFIDVKSSAHM
jgi:hypothetical protein